MVDMKTDLHILPNEVEPDILARLVEPHSSTRPGIPFAWMLTYGAKEALQNIRYFENGVRHCSLEFPIRVFFSKWSHAIVITFVPLAAIREPHILEWYVTFYEVPVEEAKTRLETWPQWPHDGRNEILVRTEVLTQEGGIQKMLDDSERVLSERGINIPSKW